MQDLFQSLSDIETRRRFRLAVFAYAYEFKSDTLISDEEFDKLAYKINLSVATKRPDLDEWFRQNFKPYTGMWIHNHPELDKIERVYYAHYINKHR